MKILIIDDSEDDRLLYRRSLRGDGENTYDIVEAENGEGGMQVIEEESPQCVLLDYSLPGRNGIEVLKRIRSRHPFLPVVMLTGQGNESIAVTAIHEGAQNYINKATITPEAIQRIIRVAIEHCIMERRIHEQRTALEIFTRALAHDLKEPVRTIKSFLDLFSAHKGFSEKEQGYLTYIQNAADRMSTLIDTVYFYTRLDGSPEQVTREKCDVAAVLEEAKENIRQLTSERGAVITNDPLPEVYINRMHLLQILQNLLCNAIRHSDKDPAIHIHAVSRPEEWLIYVTDNGPGIEAGYSGQIFEPFKRAVRHKEQGLGLGLAICKKIVESYGGKIWYEPAPQRGAVFLFTLPRQMPQAKDTPAPAVSAPAVVKSVEKPAESTHKDIASIMLVEDSEADIELTKILLIEQGHLGCHLLVAHDGAEALTMLRAAESEQRGIDLMLLDINMPGMDGFDLLKKMGEETALRRIPVVMCTTSTYDKDMERAKALGAVGYVNKPADMAKLKPVLDQLSSVRLREGKEGYMLLRAA
jgi:signal transduction histidine kinase